MTAIAVNTTTILWYKFVIDLNTVNQTVVKLEQTSVTMRQKEVEIMLMSKLSAQ